MLLALWRHSIQYMEITWFYWFLLNEYMQCISSLHWRSNSYRHGMTNRTKGLNLIMSNRGKAIQELKQIISKKFIILSQCIPHSIWHSLFFIFSHNRVHPITVGKIPYKWFVLVKFRTSWDISKIQLPADILWLQEVFKSL